MGSLSHHVNEEEHNKKSLPRSSALNYFAARIGYMARDFGSELLNLRGLRRIEEIQIHEKI